ncbi:OmpA family protein [Pararhizobium sp. LjRoot235]|uniref:OmpA family protein n=1 Tax=Pararhizobium sp. LjRoot235 TaxID=3342291 RepID=UPI003ECC835F
MTIRSKLFATVALPMLSMSIAIQPALADSLMKPFKVAQEEGIAQEGGEQIPEELLRKKRKKRQDAEQQQEQPAEEAQPSQEEQPSRAERRKKRQESEQQQEQPAEEAQPSQEEQPSRAERRKKRQEAEQQQEQPAEEAQPSQEEQPSRAERRKKRREAEQQQEQPAEEAQPSQEEQPSRAERKKRQQAEELQQQQQQQQQEEAQPSADDEAARQAAEEKQRIRAERKKRQQAEQQQQQEEVQPPAEDEAAKAAEERAKARAERKKRQAEQPQQEEVQPSAEDEAAKAAEDEAAKAAEERAKARAERRKLQQTEGQQQEEGQPPVTEEQLRPAVDGEAEPTETRRKRRDRREPIPEIVDTRSEEEKQEIARDPAATDDTVVLPVDKGAAVLDSDKEADNAGDEGVREKRRKRREQARAQEENVEIPKSDEEAQSRRTDSRPTQEELGAAIREEGRRVERVPEFGVNDLIDAFTGADRPRIDDTRDNRTVLDFGDQIIVRGDDRPRLRRNAQETYYEELSRGRTRETIERANGVRIVTIYNRYGDIVQRLRIDRDGREYLMIYAPEVDEGPRPPIYDVGEELPPMRLRVPVRDYIIDTSSDPDRDYYDFLAEPPVEQVERVYSIDEVRNSARIRDKVRRIDLDTITFATGSAEVPMSQAKTLRKVADAMLRVIEKDPGETFFIEGHTDAVGSDESNLVLSDERAESVASLLTEVYDIPAENLVTQGYGERFLKVRTLEAEQENRRVTIRRVTPLVRPVARN